jgi:Protein of unknown function (DUF2510)
MDSVVLDSSRLLKVAQAEARAAIVRFLRAQDFVVTAEQVSMVAAKRGSQIVGSVQSKKLPVVFRASFAPDPHGCTVTIHIGDAWRSGVGKVWGMNGPYRALMADISRELDDALAPLAIDGDGFAAPVMTAATRDVPLLSHANAGVGQGGGAVADKLDQLLTPNTPLATPKSLKEVVLRSSKGVASFDRMGVEGLFTVGLLVSTKPGAMPANLARDVEVFSARLERLVADQPQGRLTCDVADEEIPVAEFLSNQAAIRERLPLRTLHVCTTCKLEKVVNPDYEKLREKNRRKQVLTGAVGATVSTRGISPFLLVGSLMKFKNFDIPFVCQRCQGLDADSSIVTYCPNCGERRDEAVLRSCRRCKHNFAAAEHAEHGELWGPEPPELEPVVAAAPPSPVGAAFSAPPPPTSGRPMFAPPGQAAPPPLAAQPPPPLAAQPPPAVPAPSPSAAAPGWYSDTTQRHQHRYWDGRRWTDHVANNGVPSHDPV